MYMSVLGDDGKKKRDRWRKSSLNLDEGSFLKGFSLWLLLTHNALRGKGDSTCFPGCCAGGQLLSSF
jgi:hypothetical protein